MKVLGLICEALSLAFGVLAVTIWFDHPELATWVLAVTSAVGCLGFVAFNHLAQKIKKEQRDRRRP